VSGLVTVSASASDAVGVTKVEFYLDGALQATDNGAPYEWSWNTTATSNGNHTLESKAYDAADNVGSSAPVTVTVNNAAATISLTASGYKVKGLQKANLVWSGATSANVDVYRNGVKITTTANDGAHIDNINKKGAGSYTYKVCEAGTATCSNQATVTF
jgi:hypothetical protein